MPQAPKKNRPSGSDPVKAFLAKIGAKGGKATGKAKARTSAQARKAATTRWARRKSDQ